VAPVIRRGKIGPPVSVEIADGKVAAVGAAPARIVGSGRGEPAAAAVEEHREQDGKLRRGSRERDEVGSTVAVEIARRDRPQAIVSNWELTRRTEPSASAVEEDG